MNPRSLDKAALRGEPSYVWRAGQQRRLQMILRAAGKLAQGVVLENGCGIGIYIDHLAPHAGLILGLEYDFERAAQAGQRLNNIINGAGEALPVPSSRFDLILSHEVIEHVRDDRLAIAEMVRVLKPGGRIVLFCPNRGYPFETHGFYWKGVYRFGNVPFINYLPRRLRDKLAPHVRAYTVRDLENLFAGLQVRIVERSIIFGAYDNIISRFGLIGKAVRAILQYLEKTPLKIFGLSHFWVIER